jgi:hypothetical protein
LVYALFWKRNIAGWWMINHTNKTIIVLCKCKVG